MVGLIFIPLVIGSIVGLAFVLMLLTRIWRIPIDKPKLMDRVAQTLANGDREKALLFLEDDNHPTSTLLAYAFKLAITNPSELKDVYEYGSLEMSKRLTFGTQTLAWLTMFVPFATLIIWATKFIGVPFDVSINLTWVLIGAILAEIIFWNATLFYVKFKSAAIIKRTDEYYKFFFGMIMASAHPQDESSEGSTTDISGLVDDTKDVVELSDKFQEISSAVSKKSQQDG